MHRIFPEVNHNRVQTVAILAGSENHQFGFICVYFETVRVKPGIEELIVSSNFVISSLSLFFLPERKI